MYKIGSYVRFKKEWCNNESEYNLIHIIREIRLNPCSGGNRYLIETINGSKYVGMNPTECVDECMIESV